MADVEIYLHTPELPALIEWIKLRVGDIKQIAEDEDLLAFHAQRDQQTLPIIIQKRVEDGPWVGVWFNSIDAPWPHDKACAKDAFAYLGVTVQCDPGPKVKGDNQFLQISSAGEQLITLPPAQN